MKKFYLIISALIGFSLITYSQEILVGGNMESEDAWQTSALNTDTDNAVEYEFNYTADKPTAGNGACLHVTGTNTGAANGNTTNFIFYQQVTLQRGVTYNFTGAYKDNRTNNYWIEVYVGGNEPALGSDYKAEQAAVLVSGFKSTNWETNCPSDQIDGTFQDDACTPGSTNNTVFFEGEGDTTVYFGFRMGIWDDQGNGYTFEAFIDDISLKAAEGGTSSLNEDLSVVSVVPNPFKDQMIIRLSENIREINIINTTGQQVYFQTGINASSYQVDLSSSPAGMYFVAIKDYRGNILVKKTVKQ